MSNDKAADAMLGVGLIGLGGVNRVHIWGYHLAENVAEIVAVADNMEAVATERASELNATPYVDYRTLLEDPRVDSVDVTLPHNLHYPVVRDALMAGKHVLVEKPFALESSQCRELIQLAREKKLRLGVAENTPFVEAYLATKQLLDSGTLGAIRTVRTLIYGSEVERLRAGRWIGSAEQAGGGVIIDAGVHSFYLVEWLFGPVQSLQASGAKVFAESQVEDYALITGEIEGGARFTCELTCIAELPWGERLEIYGANGTVIVDQLDDPVVRHFCGSQDFDPEHLAQVKYEPQLWKAHSIAAGVVDFVHAVLEDRPTRVDAELGLRSVLAAEKAYESIAAGGLAVHL